jgi:YD repeat-containing protein
MQDGVYYLKKKKLTVNGNKTKEQTYKYAFNSNSDFKLGLTSTEQAVKNALNTRHYFLPIEVVDSIRTGGGSPSFLSGAKYIFDSIGTYGARLKKYRSYTTANDSTEMNFSAYDSSGNLREQYRTNDVTDVIIWGYNRTYPVAKITGSNLSTVLGLINISVINNPSSDDVLRTELNKIRTGLSGTVAQVTTFTYAPMLGMTSMTDPAGRTSYYEYDTFGRLKLVRDQNNYIIKKYDYKMNNPL